MKVTSPETKTTEILFDRRRTGGGSATKIEQNLETAVAVGRRTATNKIAMSRNQNGELKGERETVEEGGQREIRMLFSVAVPRVPLAAPRSLKVGRRDELLNQLRGSTMPPFCTQNTERELLKTLPIYRDRLKSMHQVA